MSKNIEWSGNYSIGVEEIDYQHKRFLALIKNLHDLDKSDADTSTIFESVEELERNISCFIPGVKNS